MRRSTGTLAENDSPSVRERTDGVRPGSRERTDGVRARARILVPLEIRSLAYSDLPDVIALERRAFPSPWSLAMFVLELSKPNSICVGAISNSELAGYLICSRYHTVWHLMNVAVDLDYRRLGVASGLIEHLLEEAGEDERYTLEVRVSNTEAIQMYESFGFRSAGVRRSYYHDNNEDALIMWRTQGSGPEDRG
jgi:ribosomal-protein-alanine N-acetyltransferase